MKEKTLKSKSVTQTYCIYVQCEECGDTRHYEHKTFKSLEIDESYGPKCTADGHTCKGVNKIFRITRE